MQGVAAVAVDGVISLFLFAQSSSTPFAPEPATAVEDRRAPNFENEHCTL
jgi:hypothetical protein